MSTLKEYYISAKDNITISKEQLEDILVKELRESFKICAEVLLKKVNKK